MSGRNNGLRKQHKNDHLPSIVPQKFYCNNAIKKSACFSASTIHGPNRNVEYPIRNKGAFLLEDTIRIPSPLSDFWSESDTGTGTPDFQSEESDSSTGSILGKATAEASKLLAEEWEKIERTIYDEEGEKVSRPLMLEECQQWRTLFPQLRIVGKGLTIPERKLFFRNIEPEEVIASEYTDYEKFSESEERRSESSNDTTPQNSPRQFSFDDLETRLNTEYNLYKSLDYDLSSNNSTLRKKPTKNKNEVHFNCGPKYSDQKSIDAGNNKVCDLGMANESDPKSTTESEFMSILNREHKLNREKVTFRRNVPYEDSLNDSISSMLQITAINPQVARNSISKKSCLTILKSEISSSKWMRNRTPDTSTPICDRNSAKSFMSLDTRKNSLVYSASERKKLNNASRVFTARQREGKLMPLYSREFQFGDESPTDGQRRRKVSLPPLNFEDDKRKAKLGSAKKISYKKGKVLTKGTHDIESEINYF